MNYQTAATETQNKRLKVVNACEECRRRKTKCDGEYPCARCIKSHVDCRYALNQFTKCNHPLHGPYETVIESIEERLSAIETTLRVIINSDMINKQQQLSEPPMRRRNDIHHLLNN